MAFKKSKVWFICYLMMSSVVFAMAQDIPISESEIEEMARDYISDFEKDIDTAVKNAPEDPDNDVDNEDRPRLFFLFALLPKIALILAKIAIKAVPLIIKAVAVVKAKVAATAAITAAKFATGAAIKQTLITGAVKVAKFAVETIVVDTVINSVSDAITGSPAAEEEEAPVEAEEKPNNIFDFYDNDELCECTSKTECGCCVTPKDKLPGCFNITLEKPLWDESSEVKVGAFYGGKNIMTRTLPVKKPRQRCLNLQTPFQHTKMCVCTHGRAQVGKRITQCFSLHFNQRGLIKCLVQNKGNKVWFKTNV